MYFFPPIAYIFPFATTALRPILSDSMFSLAVQEFDRESNSSVELNLNPPKAIIFPSYVTEAKLYLLFNKLAAFDQESEEGSYTSTVFKPVELLPPIT